jgi:hypothetical protein
MPVAETSTTESLSVGFWRDGASARELAVKRLVSFRKHQAGNGWLEGGRS